MSNDTDLQALHDGVQTLNEETTLLLARIREQIQRSNDAVSAAERSADDAGQSAQQASTSVTQADAFAQEAQQRLADMRSALDDAVAIVYDGGHSVAPEPGNVPIANQFGELSIGYMPHSLRMFLLGVQSRQLNMARDLSRIIETTDKEARNGN